MWCCSIDDCPSGLRKTERQYDDNDDGAHITFDIISEYQAITDLIFGKRGYSFRSYLMGVAKEQSKNLKLDMSSGSIAMTGARKVIVPGPVGMRIN